MLCTFGDYHCPLLYGCLVIQAGWKGWFDSTSCLGQGAEMLGTEACISSVYHGMERWCETGQGLRNNTRPYFWDTRWKLIKFLNHFWSWWFKNRTKLWLIVPATAFFLNSSQKTILKRYRRNCFLLVTIICICSVVLLFPYQSFWVVKFLEQ